MPGRPAADLRTPSLSLRDLKDAVCTAVCQLPYTRDQSWTYLIALVSPSLLFQLAGNPSRRGQGIDEKQERM